MKAKGVDYRSGIGFLTADKIAQNLGINPHSLMRAKAGLLYVLNQLTEEGHVYYPEKDLVYKAKGITHHFNRGGVSRRHYI